MAFPQTMRDGFQIYAIDALSLSTDQAEKFADLCDRIDTSNQSYDLVASRSTGGGHSLPTIRAATANTISNRLKRYLL